FSVESSCRAGCCISRSYFTYIEFGKDIDRFPRFPVKIGLRRIKGEIAMNVAVLKHQFESVLGGHLDWQSQPTPELVPSGVAEIDGSIGGLPRGALTEIHGPASSGRTSLLLSIVAEATAREEVCALVDAEDCLNPLSDAASGVRLSRMLWIR